MMAPKGEHELDWVGADVDAAAVGVYVTVA